MSIEAILFVVSEEYRSMTCADCKVMTSIIKCSTGQFFIFSKIDFVNTYYFEILDIYELKDSFCVSDDSNSGSGLECSC